MFPENSPGSVARKKIRRRRRVDSEDKVSEAESERKDDNNHYKVGGSGGGVCECEGELGRVLAQWAYYYQALPKDQGTMCDVYVRGAMRAIAYSQS